MSHSLSRRAPMRWQLASAAAVSALLASAGGMLLGAGPAQAASNLPTINIAATHTSITVGGALQSGGVSVVSSGTGIKEAGVILVLLNPSVTPEQLYAFLKSKAGEDPNKALRLGSIVLNTELTNGKSREAQTTLQPGQYVALLNEGESAPTVHTSFTVAAAKTPAALPPPQATIRTMEFGFRGPSTLKDGELVRFENEGFLVHMNFAIPARSKAAAKRLARFLRTGNDKQVGKLFAGPPVGFAGPLSSGAYQQEVITAKPGWYVEACFMETQDRRSHTLLGMERVIKINK